MAATGYINGDPPALFGCGHPRERSNMSFNRGAPKCKICNLAGRQRMLAAMLAAAQKAKPHLYPSKP